MNNHWCKELSLSKQFSCRVWQGSVSHIMGDTSSEEIQSKEMAYKVLRGGARKLDAVWLHQYSPVFQLIEVNGRCKCTEKCRDKSCTTE